MPFAVGSPRSKARADARADATVARAITTSQVLTRAASPGNTAGPSAQPARELLVVGARSVKLAETGVVFKRLATGGVGLAAVGLVRNGWGGRDDLPDVVGV